MRLLLALSLLILLSLHLMATPLKVNLKVPFTSQAPYANWDLPYGEACEEACLIMAHAYLTEKTLTKAIAKKEILKLVQFQKNKLGKYKSTTAQETAQIFKEFYGYQAVSVKDDITIQEIKDTLLKGNIIIAPTAGRLLKNPYFTPPGPLYHMLLIKGYDDLKKEFITHDVGTRRGSNYRYKYATLLNAIHDLTEKEAEIENGKRRVIIIQKSH